MDNFEWLEEEKKQHKKLKLPKLPVPAWLQEYWLHLTALAVIFIVLVFLVFNPASKSVTHENTSTVLSNAGHGENKQILIRMPDKTTKLANTPTTNKTEPLNAQSSKPGAHSPEANNVAAPSLAPAETFDNEPAKSEASISKPESRLPVKQIGVINPNKPTANSSNAKTTKPTSPASSNSATTTASTPQAATTLQQTTPAAKTLEPPSLAPANEAVASVNAAAAPKTISSASTTASAPKATPSTPATSNTPPAEVMNVPPENADLGTLLKRPASHYILQLFGSHSESAAKSFIAQHNLTGQALYAKVWQNNQDWYVVLYGDYTDRNQATTAINQLPANLRTQNPWARSVQSVQDAIRQRLVRGE